MRHRLAAAVAVVVATSLLAACGVREDEDPRILTDDAVPAELAEPAPASTVPEESSVPQRIYIIETRAGTEEDLVPYLKEGLKAGDKCVCVVDASDPEHVLAALGADVDLGPYLGQHQLEVQRSDETYLQGGAFSADAMS